jgi:hypothetical protein
MLIGAMLAMSRKEFLMTPQRAIQYFRHNLQINFLQASDEISTVLHAKSGKERINSTS